MNICFIMYEWSKIKPDTDSSLRIIHEAISRDHYVAVTNKRKLTIRNSVTSAFCSVFTKSTKLTGNIIQFYKKAEFKKLLLPLSGFDVIFMRENPPLDNIILNFLDSVKHDTFIINNVEGLRVANNKLYTAVFHDPENEIIPVTHVSKSRTYLKQIIEESTQEKMILKPLDGFGGSGVIVLEKSAIQNVNSLLDFYINGKGESNYVILQEYVEGAEEGDIRVLMLNGKPIGAMRRIPTKGEIRSNVHAGATVAKHTLTKKEKQLCNIVGKKLVEDGLYFAGLDIINNKLIEVNVCSPGGIVRINKLNRVKLQKQVVDYLEKVVISKENALERKKMFKKAIENA